MVKVSASNNYQNYKQVLTDQKQIARMVAANYTEMKNRDFKKGIIKFIVVLIAYIGGLFVVCCESHKNITVYDRYYQASETLLDSLERQMNWTDATDLGPVYDDYIKARSNVIVVKNEYK